VKIIADTNVLVRAAVNDDAEEGRLARQALKEAERIVVTAPTLCEFAWVLGQGYGFDQIQIGSAIRRLLASATVEAERPAVETGLAMLESGGDFADGMILWEGRRLGGEVFVTFDRKAASLTKALGGLTRLLSKKTERASPRDRHRGP
jgi:predicted nucleic-acid-binding protein